MRDSDTDTQETEYLDDNVILDLDDGEEHLHPIRV